jgi:ADP-heptose:LPS heptosyltransferase
MPAGRPAIVILQKIELIGDGLVHGPAYHAIRAAFPGRRVVGIFGRTTAFEGPLAPVSSHFFDNILSGQDLSVRALRRLLRSLQPLELVFDFRSNMRVVWGLAASAGIARRFVSNGPFYAVRFGMRPSLTRRPLTNFDRTLRMVEVAAGRPIPCDASIPGDPAAEARAAALFPPSQRYVSIVPSVRAGLRDWVHENHVPLAKHIAERGFVPVFFIGPAEEHAAAWLKARIPDAVFIDRETTGGDELALFWLIHAAAARMECCIISEGGLGHLISTRCRPSVMLTALPNIERWRPTAPDIRILQAADYGGDSVRAIPLEAVISAVDSTLASASGDSATR